MGDKTDKAKKAAEAAKKGLMIATGMQCRFCDAPMKGCKQCPKCGRLPL